MSHPNHEPLVDLGRVDPRLVVDLRYATADNFTGVVLYPAARALLVESAARRLRAAQDALARIGRGLKVWDAYRPLSVQTRMWGVRADPRFVAPPSRGSRHNRGTTVDVTLVDAAGRELEMPTGYDEFAPAARPDYAGCSASAARNRAVLHAAMLAAGFAGITSEWWHYDAPGWEAYPLRDEPLAAADG